VRTRLDDESSKVSGIRIQPNGPYMITGPLTIEDGEGNVITVPEGKTIKLCRCGHSATKPYCDGTHRRVDFVSRPTFEPEPVASQEDTE
jgi:CDGSH-type Zn-finger protein